MIHFITHAPPSFFLSFAPLMCQACTQRKLSERLRNGGREMLFLRLRGESLAMAKALCRGESPTKSLLRVRGLTLPSWPWYTFYMEGDAVRDNQALTQAGEIVKAPDKLPHPLFPWLTHRKGEFAIHYMHQGNMNATKSAIMAGCSISTAHVWGYRYLKEGGVQRAIRQIAEEQTRMLQVTAERIIQELSRLGFSNVADVLEYQNGEIILKDLANVPPDVKAAIAEISHTIDKGGASRVKVRMHDKKGSLDSLAKIFGLMREDGNISLKNGSVPPALERVVKASLLERVGNRLPPPEEAGTSHLPSFCPPPVPDDLDGGAGPASEEED